MPTKDDDIIFICRRLAWGQWQPQRLRHVYTTRVLNDTVMPFAKQFFDSDNTTKVMTKDYINCERTYFIIFDYYCLVHADSRQRSTMLPPLKWIFIFTFKTITLLNIQMLQQDSTRTNACAISCIHISYNIINSSPGPFQEDAFLAFKQLSWHFEEEDFQLSKVFKRRGLACHWPFLVLCVIQPTTGQGYYTELLTGHSHKIASVPINIFNL